MAIAQPDAARAAPVLSSEPAEVRQIGLSDIRAALHAGLEDFKAIPTQLIFLSLFYPVIGFVAARTATQDLLPLLFPLVAGLALVGPVMAVGLYELSRRREAGQSVSWLNAFDVFRAPGIVGIVGLGFALLVVFVLWIASARAIYAGTIGGAVPGSFGGFFDMVRHAPGGGTLFVVGNLVGFGFAVLVLAISVVSFPMMLDRACSPMVAIGTSLRLVRRNPATMAAWGLTVAGLLLLGSLPLFVGLAVVMPILGHATWHLYRRAVV